MLSQLGQNFDPLGFGAPFFLKARLIFEQLAVDKFDWDTDVPGNIVKEWNKWLHSLLLLEEFSMNRWYFLHYGPLKAVDVVKYQLHGFSNASNQAYSVVIYLPRLVNGLPAVSFVLGKCTVVQRHQSSWPIAKKELVAALNATKLMKQAFDALHLDDCAKYFWCDSRTVLSWTRNTDLRLLSLFLVESTIFCSSQMLQIGAFVRLMIMRSM